MCDDHGRLLQGGREDASPRNFAWRDANASVPQQLLLLVKSTTLDYQYIVYSHTEVLKCSCLYKLVNDVPVNPSDVALNFLHTALAMWLNSVYLLTVCHALKDRLDNLSARAIAIAADFASRTETRHNVFGHISE